MESLVESVGNVLYVKTKNKDTLINPQPTKCIEAIEDIWSPLDITTPSFQNHKKTIVTQETE
jgi:hypothetical protein